MKKIVGLISLILLAACSTSEKQLRETLNKNPEIVFGVIEENPEKFMEVINRVARKAQELQYAKQMSQMKEEQEKDLKEPKKPIITNNRVLLGDVNAPVTIVEYADFQCPACKMAFRNLKELQAKHGAKVRFVYKHMPLDFHKLAYLSAQYYEAIFLQSRDKAYRFYEQLFENQQQITNEAFLKKSAEKAGADMKKLVADLHSKKVKDVIDADMQEFEKFKFTGTPVILVNGVALHGAQPVEEMERVLTLTEKL